MLFICCLIEAKQVACIGLVLGYAFWYIAQNPGAQQSIRGELTAHGIEIPRPNDFRDIAERNDRYTSAKLDSLSYLRAVIDESLRMRPTSTPLPRITPPDKGSSVAGIDNIPPGTRINSFQWFVHRDPAKWDHVHEWRPERWLQRDSDKKTFREDVLWAFVSGPRTCLGNNLSYYSSSPTPASLSFSLGIKLADDMREKSCSISLLLFSPISPSRHCLARKSNAGPDLQEMNSQSKFLL